MRIDGVPSATYIIYAYRFVSTNRTNYKGFDDGKGQQLLRTLVDNKVKTRSKSQWYGSNIRQRRFAHINETGLAAAKKLPVSVYNTSLAFTQSIHLQVYSSMTCKTSEFIICKVCMYICTKTEYYMLNKYASKAEGLNNF